MYVVSVLCDIIIYSAVPVVACLVVTSLQLGLDQMPDASSSNITSFIAWFGFSIYAGAWISDLLITSDCIYSIRFSYWVVQLYSLLPPLCMSVVLIGWSWSIILILGMAYIMCNFLIPKGLPAIGLLGAVF